MKITVRDAPPRQAWALQQSGVHPLLARLYAARGVRDASELDPQLGRLLPPDSLKGLDDACAILMQAIASDLPICVVADYDCDGATACAVAVRGLRMLGARSVRYLVPNRVVDGYGLTPAIAGRVAATGAKVLVTVDNGIASLEGVDAARRAGLAVVVTDHHLPAPTLPAADAIVNPNQPGCSFPSRNLAGVGVMFYVLLGLRARLRDAGHYDNREQPRLDALLPLVALGTVADVVRLDENNRRLVASGLKRIRAQQAPLGLLALMRAARREPARASAFDLGFAVGPRINAAGRLSDMRLGIECLLCDDAAACDEMALALDRINRERREIESGMKDVAVQAALERVAQADRLPAALSVHDDSFHEGVVGIVAARLKDRFHRPAFVFAPSQPDQGMAVLKGSGRSIPGLHLRDALDLLAKREPGIIVKFGGHAMAAGCTIVRDGFERFAQALERIACEWLEPAALDRQLETDGPLEPEFVRADVARLLQEQVWGQGFPQPVFCQPFEVLSQRRVGENHLALRLRHGAQIVEGIWFGHADSLPDQAHLAYRLDVDEYQGQQRVRLIIEAERTDAS